MPVQSSRIQPDQTAAPLPNTVPTRHQQGGLHQLHINLHRQPVASPGLAQVVLQSDEKRHHRRPKTAPEPQTPPPPPLRHPHPANPLPRAHPQLTHQTQRQQNNRFRVAKHTKILLGLKQQQRRQQHPRQTLPRQTQVRQRVRGQPGQSCCGSWY